MGIELAGIWTAIGGWWGVARAAAVVAIQLSSSAIAKKKAKKASAAAAAQRAKELAKLRARLNGATFDAPEAVGGPRPTRTENVKSPTQVHELAFGTVKKGGLLAYINGTGTNNAYLHLIVIHAAHQVEEFKSLWLDNEELTMAPGNVVYGKYANYVHARTMLGADDQAAEPFIVAQNANWTTDHRLRGRAYSYVRLQDNINLFPQFIPNVLATFDGENRIYDPRTDTTGFSRNPALQAAYILETYLDVSRSRINEASLIESANICDAYVATRKGDDDVTADDSADTLTMSTETIPNGTPFYLLTSDTLPGGLAVDTLYRAIDSDGSEFQVSLDSTASAEAAKSASVSGATWTVVGNGWTVGTRVKLVSGTSPTAATGTWTPNDIVEPGTYYVRTVPTSDTLTIAPYAGGPAITATSVGAGHTLQAIDKWTGSAIDITDTGTGTHKLRIAERRYESDGFLSLVGDPERFLEPIATAMAGEIIDHGGTFYILAGAYRAPIVTVTDDEIVSGIKLSTAESSVGRANSIKGTFVAADQYELTTDFPAIKDATFIGQDGGAEQFMEADLEFVRSVSQAQRVGSILLRDQRMDRTLEFDVNLLIGLDVKPGDSISIDSDVLGITGEYRIDEHKLIFEMGSDARAYVHLSLKETAASVYEWDAETDEQLLADATKTNLPGSNDTIPINASVEMTFYGTASDTRLVALADYVWTDPVDTIDSIEIETTMAYEYRIDGSGDPWEAALVTETTTSISTGVGSESQSVIDENLTTPEDYEFQNHVLALARVRAKISADEWGDWVVVG